jgi:hypothetical protein
MIDKREVYKSQNTYKSINEFERNNSLYTEISDDKKLPNLV